MSEALRKKVFFMTLRWLDSSVHTSEQRVSVLATSSNVDTESGTSVSSTGRRIGGGMCSCYTQKENNKAEKQERHPRRGGRRGVICSRRCLLLRVSDRRYPRYLTLPHHDMFALALSSKSGGISPLGRVSPSHTETVKHYLTRSILPHTITSRPVPPYQPPNIGIGGIPGELTPAMCSTEASLLSLPKSGNTVDHGVFSGSRSRLTGHSCSPVPPPLPTVVRAPTRVCTASTVCLMA